MTADHLLQAMIAVNALGVVTIVGKVWAWTTKIDRRLTRLETHLRLITHTEPGP